MAKRLSVLIPSRNEAYLTKTIQSCFDNAAGEVEVVVCLEGYWPSDWKQLTDKYPNLHTVHHGEPQGLRPAINSAAASAISRGAKYLFKLDAHCMLDEGYDVKLLADIDDDWIVVPRRKRLDAEKWELQDVGKPDIDYHYLSFPNDPDDWGGPGLNGKPWTQRILDRRDKPEFDVDDEMSSQGSAWCMAADYFTKLELMDTGSYGPFWNELQECGLKCWLSGGKVKVNKKTWYAHLRKGKEYEGADGKKGRGYTLPESWLQQGRNHTMSWIWNEAWSKQTLPFKWLIEHFWPVPSWPDNWEEILYATRKPRVVPVGSGGMDGDGGSSVLGQSDLPVAGSAGLKIHEARYGVRYPTGGFSDSVDVVDRLRLLIKDNSLDIIVNNSTLTPDSNPFRGKKKTLKVVYSLDGGEQITRRVEEKDWLIIGPVDARAENTAKLGLAQAAEYVEANKEGLATISATLSGEDFDTKAHVAEVIERMKDDPFMAGSIAKTAAAMNDYLIRRFSISPQRLRGPMPIELRDFHRNDLAQLFAELGFNRGAEIGVAEGNYSEVLLKANPELELHLIDPWSAYSGNPQSKSKEKDDYALNETRRKTTGYKNVNIIIGRSMDVIHDKAFAEVIDNLDFVYIDGHHSYPYVMCDIIEWTKRVRSGGVIALDDIYKLNEKWGAGPMEAIYDYTRAMRINPWWLIAARKSVDAFFVKP